MISRIKVPYHISHVYVCCVVYRWGLAEDFIAMRAAKKYPKYLVQDKTTSWYFWNCLVWSQMLWLGEALLLACYYYYFMYVLRTNRASEDYHQHERNYGTDVGFRLLLVAPSLWSSLLARFSTVSPTTSSVGFSYPSTTKIEHASCR